MMSGTTKQDTEPSRTCRGTGLVIAAHGERGGALDNAGLEALCRAVAGLLGGIDVRPALLFGDPEVSEVVARLTARRVLVYPLFLSDGYYVRKILPQRVAQAVERFDADAPEIEILAPLGTDPGLARLVDDAVARSADDSGPRNLLLAAHGSSKSAQSRQTIERLERDLAASDRYRSVSAAYLEEPPFVSDMLTNADDDTVLVNLFISSGMHGGEDMPRMQRERKKPLPQTPPLTEDPGLPALIATAVRARMEPASEPAG